MKIIDDGPPLIIGQDVHRGERYNLLDMARDCGCGTCQAILEDAARRKAARDA